MTAAKRRLLKFSEGPQVASILQAPGFRSDVSVFRLNATAAVESGSESAFRRNTAERVTPSRRLITRRSQVQILPPLLRKALVTGPFCRSASFRSYICKRFPFTFRGQDGNLYRVIERDAPKPAVVPFVEVATLFGFDVAGIGEREYTQTTCYEQ
jgi:hypothetical protein